MAGFDLLKLVKDTFGDEDPLGLFKIEKKNQETTPSGGTASKPSLGKSLIDDPFGGLNMDTEDIVLTALNPVAGMMKTTGEELNKKQKEEEAEAWASDTAFWDQTKGETWDYIMSVYKTFKEAMPADMNLADVGTEALALASRTGAGVLDFTAQNAATSQKLFPVIAATATGQAELTAQSLDKESLATLNAMRDELSPGWRERLILDPLAALGKETELAQEYMTKYYGPNAEAMNTEANLVGARAQQYLTEGMPEDVAAKLMRRFSEASGRGGVLGQAALSGAAFTSAIGMDKFITGGAAMAGQASDLRNKAVDYTQATANLGRTVIQSASELGSLIKNMMPVQTDRSALYQSNLSTLAGATLASGNQAMSTGQGLTTDALAAGINVGQYNRDYANNIMVSSMGYGTDMTAAGLEFLFGKYAARENSRAGQWRAWGEIWGSVFGMMGSIVGGIMSKTSDARAKEGIRPSQYGLREVLLMNPVRFQYKPEFSGRAAVGVVAQEVERIIPEIVSEHPTLHLKMVDYGQLVPVLIKAVQELSRQVAALREGS